MKTKKFVFDLDSKVAIYVPSTTNAVESCDNSAMVKRVLSKLSDYFGGGYCDRCHRRMELNRTWVNH